MSFQNTSWFHCGRCGSLFQAKLGKSEHRVCSKCSANPSLRPQTPAANFTAPAHFSPTLLASPPIAQQTHQQQPLRNRNRSALLLKLGGACLLVLFAILSGAYWLWQNDSVNPPLTASDEPAKNQILADNEAFLNDAIPHCIRTISGFLSAETAELRNSWVLTPLDAATRMTRFYNLNPLPNIGPQTLTLTHRALLPLPATRAIETYWKTRDGHHLDAVFVEENGEWRLDWDHFARFSDTPWPLFLAGSGSEQGEFRLLARQRLVDEGPSTDTLSIVFYAPHFGSNDQLGPQSPEFLIKRDSPNGRLLSAAFQLESRNQRVFGGQLPRIDPEGLIRVRVKIRRDETDNQRRFELDELLACHWYATTAPGIEIPPQALAK